MSVDRRRVAAADDGLDCRDHASETCQLIAAASRQRTVVFRKAVERLQCQLIAAASRQRTAVSATWDYLRQVSVDRRRVAAADDEGDTDISLNKLCQLIAAASRQRTKFCCGSW